jgi:hypothetical protein
MPAFTRCGYFPSAFLVFVFRRGIILRRIICVQRERVQAIDGADSLKVFGVIAHPSDYEPVVRLDMTGEDSATAILLADEALDGIDHL